MVAKNTAPKAPRTPRAAKNTRAAAAPAVAEDTLLLAHATQFIDAGDNALSDLISSLGEPDEIIERAEVESLDLPAAALADPAGDDALNDLMASLEVADEVVTPAAVVAAAPDASTTDMALSDLIASLNAPAVVLAAPAVVEMDDAMLEAAVSSAEATEATVFAATPVGVVDAGAIPSGDASDVPLDPAVIAGEKGEKTKRVPVPRKHYTDKTERLKDKLGTSLGEYSVLTLADAVNEDELAAKMEETMVIIRGMSGKAQNWAVKLVEYLAGKKSSMSEVTLRIFKLLEKDGFVATGATGNLYLDLISKPYSPGAARAMGGNNLAALSGLKIITSVGKGRFVLNPDSLLAMKANSMLFAAPAAPAAVVSEIAAASTPDLTAADFETDETDAAAFEAEDTTSLEAALLDEALL
jgi:hypothetical protein